MAVNPVTNMIYVVDMVSGTITIIDWVANSTTTKKVGSYPTSIAINAVTNKIYVASATTGTLRPKTPS